MKTVIQIIDANTMELQETTRTVSNAGWMVAASANWPEALRRIREGRPNLIVLDATLPDVDGFEVCRRLRRDHETADIPILFLTGQNSPDQKTMAFEAGADDHLSKPCEPSELCARIQVLLNSSAPQANRVKASSSNSRIFSVFSLQGGAGVSTIAANLATHLFQLRGAPTVLVDLVPSAGLSSMMFNLSPKNSWSAMVKLEAEAIDEHVVNSLLIPHSSGIQLLPAPRVSNSKELLTGKKVARILSLLRDHHGYIVLDLPHDLQESTVAALDASNAILAIMGSDVASVTAQLAVADAFQLMNYPEERIRVVLNQTHESERLEQRQIETALKRPVEFGIPFASGAANAVNLGSPLAISKPGSAISLALADLAFQLSKNGQSPTSKEPSEALQRATRRLAHREHKPWWKLFN